MAKTFSQEYLLENLSDDPTFLTRRMFGGLAIYLKGRMVLVLMESDEDDKEWKGKYYSFPIWRGLLFPTFREFHADILSKYPNLVAHPVLSKWLYLPLSHNEYETIAEQLILEIQKGNPLFGIEPKSKKKSKKKRRTSKKS